MKVKTLRFDSSKTPAMRVIARNVRMPGGEIDIIAREHVTVIAFVEVKARSIRRRFGSALSAVDARKRSNAACALAADWLQISAPAGARAIRRRDRSKPWQSHATRSRCVRVTQDMDQKHAWRTLPHRSADRARRHVGRVPWHRRRAPTAGRGENSYRSKRRFTQTVFA